MLPLFLSDILISRMSFPLNLDNATARGVLWQAAPGQFLLELPGVARYLVMGGDSIFVEWEPQADQEKVNYFLRMTPLAALLYQRGFVVFHAAAVANNQGAVLLAGDSGTGKSTLLAALLQRGWTMLSDDLAAVTIDEQGQVLVLPIFPEIALWPDALKKLGIKSNSLLFCDANRQKMTTQEQFTVSHQRLRSIYCLNVHGKSSVDLLKLPQSACYRAIGTFLYNSQIADTLMDRRAYLHCASSIASSIPVYNLYRPRNSQSLSALADQVTTSPGIIP